MLYTLCWQPTILQDTTSLRRYVLSWNQLMPFQGIRSSHCALCYLWPLNPCLNKRVGTGAERCFAST